MSDEKKRDSLDSTSTAILKQIESLGFAVIIRDHGTSLSAIKSDGSLRFDVSNDDPYRGACKLAQLVGIELEDG